MDKCQICHGEALTATDDQFAYGPLIMQREIVICKHLFMILIDISLSLNFGCYGHHINSILRLFGVSLAPKFQCGDK